VHVHVLSFRIEQEAYEKLKLHTRTLKTSVSSLLRNFIYHELNCAPPPEKVSSIHKPATTEKNSLHYVSYQDFQLLQKQVEELSHHLNLLMQSHSESPKSPQSEKSKKAKLHDPPKKHLPDVLSLTDIVIPENFSPPRSQGVQEMVDYYNEHGKLDKEVTVRAADHMLLDGYKRYVAAKKLGLSEIPVKFV